MAGTKSEGVGKAVKDFRDLGLAIAGVKTQFRAIISPIQGCVNELQKLAKVSDMSLTSGASVQNIKVFGAALKALGGDVGSAAKTFGFLDSQVTKMKLGESNQLGDLAWKFNFRLTGMEKPEEQFDAVRKAMSGLSEAGKREFSRALGLDESMFRLATMAAEEYDEVKKRAERMNFDTDTQKEMTEDALKMREALGNLSSAWSKLWSGVGSIFAKAAPLINWIAEAIAWIANFKGVLWGLALVISAVVGVNIIRFIGALKKLLQVAKMIPSLGKIFGNMKNWFSFGEHIRKIKDLWTWLKGLGKIDVAPAFKRIGGIFKGIGGVILHPIQSIKALYGWLGKLWTTKGSGILAKGFHAVAFAIRHPIQFIVGFIGKIKSAVTAGKGMFGAFKGGFAVIGGIFKGIGGLAKGIFGGIVGAVMFCVESLGFAWESFDKYILGSWDSIKLFFTETIGEMFSSWDGFCAGISGLWDGFFEGLAEGLGNAGRFLVNFFTLGLLSKDTLDKVQSWFEDLFNYIFGWVAHPFDSLVENFSSAISGVKSVWKGVRSFLPSWLGGYSDEEKKQMEEAEKNGKKNIDGRKSAADNTAIAYDNGFGAEEYEVVRNGAEAYRAAFQEAKMNGDEEKAQRLSAAWSSRNSDIGQTKRIMRGQGYSDSAIYDAVNNMYGAMSVAGENLKAVNSAAAGASNMVQTTNDNRSSVSNSATNTSVKVDNININSKADNPEKLGVELKSALNAYTNYGLSVSTSLAGQS